MAVTKQQLVEMAEQGLFLFVVTWSDGEDDEKRFSCWAKDAQHAGEQCEDAYPEVWCLDLIETAAEHTERTGKVFP